jgi:hypothetical protein
MKAPSLFGVLVDVESLIPKANLQSTSPSSASSCQYVIAPASFSNLSLKTGSSNGRSRE